MSKYNYSLVPIDIIITNTSSKAKALQFFRTNLVKTIPAGDTLIILATTSAEVFYYLSLNSTGLSVITTEPKILSARSYLDDDTIVDFVGDTITLTKDTVTEYIEATMTVPVELVGIPKVYMTIGGTEVIYGAISVDSEDATKVIITPAGSNGIAALVGTFQFRVPAGALTYESTLNEETIITLTVVE